MERDAKIFVAGHKGLVGSAIVRALKDRGYKNLIQRDRGELDLTDAKSVSTFFATERPKYVFLAAGKVGGILANSEKPAEFIRENILIETNVIHSAYECGVSKLLFLGSSCIYPKLSSQPIKEECLLRGELEETNKPYAIAKIAGLIMCESYNKQFGTNFISAMPTNLYGPNDNFDLTTSHVIPALIRKLHDARINVEDKVTLWGTGTPKREFLYVDDLADACIFLMDNYNGNEIINVGTGEDISVKDLAIKISEIVGFKGKIEWDESKPDGTPRKLLDVSKINNLGWNAKTKLSDGLRITYDWFSSRE